MFEVMWKEVNKSDKVVTKRKEFKTESAMQKFIEKLYDKNNFYKFLGMR